MTLLLIGTALAWDADGVWKLQTEIPVEGDPVDFEELFREQIPVCLVDFLFTIEGDTFTLDTVMICPPDWLLGQVDPDPSTWARCEASVSVPGSVEGLRLSVPELSGEIELTHVSYSGDPSTFSSTDTSSASCSTRLAATQGQLVKDGRKGLKVVSPERTWLLVEHRPQDDVERIEAFVEAYEAPAE